MLTWRRAGEVIHVWCEVVHDWVGEVVKNVTYFDVL